MPIEIESPEQIGYGKIACNLAESSVSDFILNQGELLPDKLALCYGDHMGKPELRQLIASECENLDASNVILTAGAVSGLFIISTSLLDKEDHAIVAYPNYSTNIETPKTIGCELSLLELKMEEGFKVNIQDLEALIKPNTKLISLTSPHNPTGTVLPLEDLLTIIRIAEKYNCHVLLDETYRDLNFTRNYPVAASLSEKVISVSSVSKAYGLPGVRIGWLICKDPELMEIFLAAKEQIFLCNSVIDEEIAYQAILNKSKFLLKTREQTKINFAILKSWLGNNSHILEYVLPEGGVVCFPRIKKSSNIDIERFYEILNTEFKTYVGPGHWFNMDKDYFRIGFGWPSESELIQGLENISRALKKCL